MASALTPCHSHCSWAHDCERATGVDYRSREGHLGRRAAGRGRRGGGFSTVKREGIELIGSFTATVNADLRVGSLEETITVTGESPVVDVQSAKRQQVLPDELIQAIPTARVYHSLMGLIPGINLSGTSDVGGLGGPAVITFSIHGGRFSEGPCSWMGRQREPPSAAAGRPTTLLTLATRKR